MQNIEEYATSLDIPVAEVTAFLALREVAHARLFAGVPWLMPRFEALIGKYARGITMISTHGGAASRCGRDGSGVDLRAVNLTKVGIPDTPEQREALVSLETLRRLSSWWIA